MTNTAENRKKYAALLQQWTDTDQGTVWLHFSECIQGKFDFFMGKGIFPLF